MEIFVVGGTTVSGGSMARSRSTRQTRPSSACAWSATPAAAAAAGRSKKGTYDFSCRRWIVRNKRCRSAAAVYAYHTPVNGRTRGCKTCQRRRPCQESPGAQRARDARRKRDAPNGPWLTATTSPTNHVATPRICATHHTTPCARGALAPRLSTRSQSLMD